MFQVPTRHLGCTGCNVPDNKLNWGDAKKMLATITSRLQVFDPKIVDTAMMKRLKPYMASRALQDPDVAGAISKACKGLAMWVQAVYEFGS